MYVFLLLYKFLTLLNKNFGCYLISAFCLVGLRHFSLYGMVETIFVTKISVPNELIGFKFGVLLYIDGAYIVRVFLFWYQLPLRIQVFLELHVHLLSFLQRVQIDAGLRFGTLNF